MKYLLYSILNNDLDRLKHLKYDKVSFTLEGKKYLITKEQIHKALCCKRCKYELFDKDPYLLIKQFISKNYVYVDKPTTCRRRFKEELKRFLHNNRVHLTPSMWKWCLLNEIKDTSTQYRKLRIRYIKS
jgi:hypothetical protein